MLSGEKLQNLLEAILFAAGKPLSENELLDLFPEGEKPALGVLRDAIWNIQVACENRGVDLVHVGSGYRFQIKLEWAPYICKLWEEKAPRYSRALLETLALIAYRQPITRGEIENIRGVSISTSIFKTLLEDRQWIRVVGHKDVPGRPALYATTKGFLDYFGLKNLQDLPTLPDILSLEDESVVYDTALPAPKQMELDYDEEEMEQAIENEHENAVETKTQTQTETETEDEAEEIQQEVA